MLLVIRHNMKVIFYANMWLMFSKWQVAWPIDHMHNNVTFLATVNALLGSHFELIRNGEELLSVVLINTQKAVE